jgi:hypothetical protein
VSENLRELPAPRLNVLRLEQVEAEAGHSGVTPFFGYVPGHIRGVFTPAPSPAQAVANPGVFKPVSSFDALSDPVDARYLVTDAEINEGDSGAPAVRVSPGGEIEIVGLCQSYSSGRAISNLIHVAELREFPAGDNKTVDRRVKQILSDQGAEYGLDEEGRFFLEMGGQEVVVESCTHQADGERREVWSPVYIALGALPAELSQTLLEANSELSRGRFELRRMQEAWIAAFCLNISADASAEVLVETIRVASQAAAEIQSRLPRPLAEEVYGEEAPWEGSPAGDIEDIQDPEDATNEAQALRGRWEAVIPDDPIYLEFMAEGDCRLEFDGGSATANYAYRDSYLVIRGGGQTLLEGRTEFDLDGRFHLVVPSGERILFRRVS